MIPGSTSIEERDFSGLHEWISVKLTYENYYKEKGNLRLGAFFEGSYSSQELFNNYTSSLLRAPAFEPNPESKTLFLENFRAFSYAAIGHRFLFNVRDNFELRFAGYLYQPYREILKQADGSVTLGSEFAKRYTVLTGALVYHTPIAPISFNVNYYHNIATKDQFPSNGFNENIPVSLLFHVGYILFNKRALN